MVLDGMPDKTEDARQLRAAYLAAYPACQYTAALSRHVSFGRPQPDTLCVDHIWNRHGRQSECYSNYATACFAAHAWKHANSIVARIAISWLKMTLGGEHWNFDTLRPAAGRHVPAWVEYQVETRPDLPDWAVAMGREIMEAN